VTVGAAQHRSRANAVAPTPSARRARAHARAVVARSGTSFVWGMRVLAKERRRAMYAVYAFCREIDDVADGTKNPDAKLDELVEWRREVNRLFEGEPKTLTGRALLDPVRRFHLPKEEFILLIEGMEMDAKGPMRAPSLGELMHYCRRVAGAVGLLSMRVFGAPKSDTSDKFALSLANALQLTNILRDLGEDAARGRLYLPRELLDRHGVHAADADEALRHPNLEHAAKDLGDMAAAAFRDARQALHDLDWRVVRPAMPMMGVYELYLDRLTARGWDRIAEPVALPKALKLFTALRYAIDPPL